MRLSLRLPRLAAASLTEQHFVIARAILGAYVAVHFAMLWPYGRELFSREGMLPAGQLSPLLRAFPNVLSLYDAPWFVGACLGLASCAGLALALGQLPRASALTAYYVWACVFGRNPLIDNPSLAYVGLMLLVSAGVGDARALTHEGAGRVRHVLWLAMALGYTYSGLSKLTSPSWLDGSALTHVLHNPLARPGLPRACLLALPDAWLRAASVSALALEIGFLPLSLFARLRPYLWTGMLALHLSLLALVQFADLSLAMLILHLFCADPTWLRERALGRALLFLRALAPTLRRRRSERFRARAKI